MTQSKIVRNKVKSRILAVVVVKTGNLVGFGSSSTCYFFFESYSTEPNMCSCQSILRMKLDQYHTVFPENCLYQHTFNQAKFLSVSKRTVLLRWFF